MYKNSKNNRFWIYENYNRIELHSQQIASFSNKLICNCRQYKSAVRIAKQIAKTRNISFQEVFSYSSFRSVWNEKMI